MTGRPPVGLGTSPLPNDRPRPPQPTLARGVVALGVQPRTVSAMRRLGHAAGGELFDGLAAVHAWWLHLLVESSRVCFDVAYPHPQRGDVSSVAQCGIDPLDSFAALLEHTRRAVVVGLEAPATTTAHTRLSLQLRPTDGSVPVAVTAATACDVSVELVEQTGGHLTGRIDFDADIFDPATVAAMGSLWCRLLDAAAADPHTALLDHDLLTDEQRHRQLSWNRYDGQPPACVHDVIAAQTDRTPDATAVSVGDADLTYRQLDDRARVIASSLRAAGAGPGALVALLLDRGPDVVASILGSLQAGAAFLPLDPRQPIARNTFCINDTGADFVLTDQHIPAGESIAATVIDIAALDPPPTVAAPRHAVTPGDPAYVICTSGSTGRPKPVIVEHRGAINLMRGLVGEFGIRAGDTVLSVASIGFDMALFDIFSALACGARVVLADTANAVNPRSLNRLIATRGTTFLFTTPTMWTALIAAGWAGDPRLRAAAGGETLSDGLAEALLARCGAVWNGYGPTEATAGATMARLAPGDIVTVGRPLPNVRVYVVDARGRLNPPGVPGEIVVGGAGVGRGYLNRPDENARRFADDPWHAGGRIYRTGDRGRYLADGRIQHLGRYDDQIKIRGCRIEPGEIESVLGEHPAVRACAVVNCDGPTGTDRLVAYIVAGPDAVGAAAARTWLRRRLPDYMVPSAFVYLDALPMTVSGKLDKAALPAPDVPAEGIAQCTATEMRLAELWSELLGGPVTDVHADFFDLGGDSLLAAQLITGVERTFGVTVALEAFLVDGRAVATMAGLIDSGDPAGAEPSNTRLPVHFIFADVASAMSVRHFTDRWGAEQPVYAFIPEQPDGRFDRTVSVEEHARRSLALIRERQPHGPIALAGYSIGGLVAYEVARQAARNGDTVEWLGVVDAVAPPLRRAQLTVRSRLRSVNSRPQRQKWSAYWTFVRRMATSRSRARRAEFDYRGVTDIGCRYRQSGHSIPVAVFASAATAAAAGEPSLGWDAYHDGPVVAHRLGGDHASLLAEPEVGLLADCVHRSLCRAGDVETVGVGGHHA